MTARNGPLAEFHLIRLIEIPVLLLEIGINVPCIPLFRFIHEGLQQVSANRVLRSTGIGFGRSESLRIAPLSKRLVIHPVCGSTFTRMNSFSSVSPEAFKSECTAAERYNYIESYVGDLDQVIDMNAIKEISSGSIRSVVRGSTLGDPLRSGMGSTSTVVSLEVDPTFSFMTVDWDGQIRMDPSSPYAMQRLIALKDRFDIAFGCDTDHDRHGIVTRSSGLLPPNHYLSAAVFYLFNIGQNGSPRRRSARRWSQIRCSTR